MADFLLELLSEEIPARMQGKARADLERLFAAELEKAGLKAADIITYSTPRRLALIARELPEETSKGSEEIKGPKASAPQQAVDGFMRKTRTSFSQLVEREGTLFAIVEWPSQPTTEILAEIIHTIIRAFQWPKSMRWGAASASTESLRWVRPLQGIIAILGDRVVECEIDGITSGNETVGHRFHDSGGGDGPGNITIAGAEDYAAKLREAHVIVDHKEREGIIRERANALAAEAGLVRKQDPGLVQENAGLTEWPVPLLGSFDEAFLAVAPEAITLAMRSHQKYFACEKPNGSLSPHFICVANLEPKDGGTSVVVGNEKVLAARLSDAKFFWEQDQKVSLADHAKKLDQIVFHEKLGTVADKVDRVAKLARWLVEEGIVPPSPLVGEGRGEGHDAGTASHSKASSAADTAGPSPNPLPQGERAILADKAEQAARLAKADLVTGMVGEFADLQGIMGGYYAANEGLDPEIAAAIRDHYKPVGQGDEVPSAPVTVAVSLADKLDTLSSFFAAQERPTGSKDPYALRRAAIGVIRLVIEGRLRISMMNCFEQADDASGGHFKSLWRPQTGVGHEELGLKDTKLAPFGVGYPSFAYDLLDFFADRLKVQQREAGVRHDLIDAVFALGGEDDLVRLLARVKALQAFLKTVDGANLLAGYKRAANILKKEKWEPVEGDYNPEPEEALLREALGSAEPKAADAIEAEDFEGAMAALATLRKPIDAFFEKVKVNDDDEVKRASRLGMLARMRDAVHQVADFSKIEGGT